MAVQQHISDRSFEQVQAQSVILCPMTTWSINATQMTTKDIFYAYGNCIVLIKISAAKLQSRTSTAKAQKRNYYP